MKKRTLALLILTFAVLSVSTFYPIVLGAPVGDIQAPQGTSIEDGAIDGTIGTEWDDAGDWVVTDLTIPNKIRAKHDGTYLYILLVVTDDTDERLPLTAHDWTGVEFDINGDEKTMGTTGSPDDAEFCDYQISGGEDWWMTGTGSPRGNDTSVGGTNDVVAAKGFNTTHTIWEFKKKLNSGDSAGYDIAMDPSQTGVYGKDRIEIALAYQDGKTGKHSDHSDWYLLILTVLPQPGWIDGHVTDSDTGAAIVGATVTADAYSATTDANGYYKIELPPGTYDVAASAPDYFSETKPNIVVESGATTTVNFALEPIPPGVPSATLVRRSAWPEHHHWDESKDADLTLTGKVHNDGTLSELTVRVQFDISYYDDTWSGTFYTGNATIDPCTIVDLTVTVTRTDLAGKFGTYYVKAQAEYLDPDTGVWVKDGKIKDTKFKVVP
ncbi:MAG: carboxypeptidase-like regulatory domain-containing protein [Candidatus Heimdallarchaeota archaeon]